jgi:hypothetical protein
MNSTHNRTGGGTAATAASSFASADEPAPSVPSHAVVWKVLTPNDCIRLNGGDYNACNVGNSGRGDLPHLPLH